MDFYSEFKNKVLNRQFLVTSEIGPPKGVDIKTLMSDVSELKGLVDAVNVTDLQSSVMRLGSIAVCHLLLEKGIEPILQMTCRDRNRLALQSDVLSAYVLGIRNVLVLTGDHPVLGDHPDAKAVFDLEAVTLLHTIKLLNEGHDLSGKELKGKPDIFAGAVVNPGADPIEPEIIKLEKKIESGAKFFQTQAIFDPGLFMDFLGKIRHIKIPMLAGIVLLKSPEMANYMNKNVAGVNVPDGLIKEIGEAKDRKTKSVEIAARIIKELKTAAAGIHIMPIGWDKLVPQVIKAADLR